MLKNIIVTVFLLATAFAGYSQIVLTGSYQGKNLYVQNPFDPSGVGFCVTEVRINGTLSTDEINSSAFEIDFSQIQGLKRGDDLKVEIKHKSDCEPRVLNSEVIQARPCFETINIKVDDDGVLRWKTKNECGSLPYIVEQYRWNKWVKIGEVQGSGTPDEHEYEFKTIPHSGENKFRVKQVDSNGSPRYSDEAKYRSPNPPVEWAPKKVRDEITFSAETMFEIYDKFGNIVKRGFGEKVDVSNLPSDVYYLNLDNESTEFVKK